MARKVSQEKLLRLFEENDEHYGRIMRQLGKDKRGDFDPMEDDRFTSMGAGMKIGPMTAEQQERIDQVKRELGELNSDPQK